MGLVRIRADPRRDVKKQNGEREKKKEREGESGASAASYNKTKQKAISVLHYTPRIIIFTKFT